jgi:hypothetical protein
VGAEAHRAVALVTKDPPRREMTVNQLLVKVNQLHHLLFLRGHARNLSL